MLRQPDSDLQAELAALRQRLGNLEAEHRELKRQVAPRHRPAFSRKFLFSALPIALLLAAGGTLYAVDALFIDKDGNVSILGKVKDSLSFESKDGPKLILYPTAQIIGVQGYTQYFRSNKNFAWYKGGTHSDTELDPGTGAVQMVIKDGNVGIGTNSPEYALQLSNFVPGDRYVTLTTEGGNKYKTGIKLWAWQKDYGFTIEHDETKNGLNILRNYADGPKPNADGQTALFVSTTSGNVGIGTTSPSTMLDINGTLNVNDNATFNKESTIKGSLTINGSNGTYPNPIRFTSQWSGFPDGSNVTNQAEISNDTNSFKTLMIVGNKSNDGTTRSVSIWDRLTVKGDLYVDGWIYNIHDGGYRRLESRGSIVRSHDAMWSDDTYTSDKRLKASTDSISTALEKVRKLRGVTYLWNQEALNYFTADIEKTISAGPNAVEEENRKLWKKERDKRYKELSKLNVGVIAQDVEAVLPEAVSTDEKGYKSVRYHYLIPLLIEAVKEQDKVFKEQAQTVARQRAEIERLAIGQQTLQRRIAEVAAVEAQLERLEAAVQRGTAARAFVAPDPVTHLSAAQAR